MVHVLSEKSSFTKYMYTQARNTAMVQQLRPMQIKLSQIIQTDRRKVWWLKILRHIKIIRHTLDGFIFVGTNFLGLKKYQTFVQFKIRGHCIFLHKSYRKSLFHWHWNLWIRPSTKTTKNWYPTKVKPSTASVKEKRSNYCKSWNLPHGC